MNIAVVGSRGFKRLDLIRSSLKSMAPCTVVSGGAEGVDQEAERVAKELGCETLIFPAEWKKYGKRAGFLRNRDIVDHCDAILVFWDGKSRGTQHSLKLALLQKKPLILTLLDEDGTVSCAKRNWP